MTARAPPRACGPTIVLVETKSETGESEADRLLPDRGRLRPTSLRQVPRPASASWSRARRRRECRGGLTQTLIG